MLKLSASYSKKVPVAGQDYSSQSYHCSVERELSEGLKRSELSAEIHRTFALVRDSVEAEIGGSPKAEGSPPVETKTEDPKPTPSGQKATNKQIRFILDLARDQGKGLHDINAQVAERFGKPSIYDLDRKSASRLLDQLKAA